MTISPQSHNIVIRDARLIDPAQSLDACQDLFITNGRIAGIGQQPAEFVANQTIDASGMLVIPSLVDLCANLREPGHGYKGTILSETHAAAAAGISHLCCPPNTNPIVDTPAVATLIYEKADAAGFVNAIPIAALTQGLEGEQLSELYAMKQAGCPIATNLREPFANTRIQQRCLEYAATHDITVILYPNDYSLAEGGVVHDGAIATKLGLAGIPETAETIALARDLLLVENIGVKAHIAQLSSARSAALIADAKARGASITADVNISQLMLTENDVDGFNSAYHVMPPLRTVKDRDGLRQAIKDGVVDAICSNHEPHEAAAKLAPFAATDPGISTLDSYIPKLLQLVRDDLIDYPRLVDLVSTKPAAILGLKAPGLKVGEAACLCVIDSEKTWLMDEASMVSAGTNSPFLNQELQGRVQYTFCNGKITFAGN